MLVYCPTCEGPPWELPAGVDLSRSWLRCTKCGSRLIEAEPEARDPFLCERCGLPLTESTLGVWECRNGCRMTPKFILGHHTMKAPRHYMSVSG